MYSVYVSSALMLFYILAVAVIIFRRNKKIIKKHGGKASFLCIDGLVYLVKDDEHETVNRIINRPVNHIEEP